MNKLERLYESVLATLRDLFSYSDVPKADTLSQLQALRDELDTMIEALKGEIEREK